MRFMSCSCINLRNVTVSSFAHTVLMVLCPVMFHLFRKSLSHMLICVKINLLVLFPLHMISFCFYQYTKFSPPAKCRFFLATLLNFWFYHSGFFMCRQKMHILKTGGWKGYWAQLERHRQKDKMFLINYIWKQANLPWAQSFGHCDHLLSGRNSESRTARDKYGRKNTLLCWERSSGSHLCEISCAIGQIYVAVLSWHLIPVKWKSHKENG